MKDLFAFNEEIARKDSEFFIESLAVDSLFPNIPLEETNKICYNTVFEILKVLKIILRYLYSHRLLLF